MLEVGVGIKYGLRRSMIAILSVSFPLKILQDFANFPVYSIEPKDGFSN